jgi:transposase
MHECHVKAFPRIATDCIHCDTYLFSERPLKKSPPSRVDFVIIWHESSWMETWRCTMLPDAPQYVEPDEVDLLVFEDLVPQDHYLRQVLRVINFERCRELLASCYCKKMGRPAIEPTLMLKLEFLAFHHGLSDREVVNEAKVNMAFRYFLHLSRRSPLPHPTLMTHFRNRLGPEKHQQVFDDIVGQARQHGLVKDRLRLKDATHIIANIAVPSTIRLVAQTREELLTAVEPFAPQRVATERARADSIRLMTEDATDKESLLQRVSHLQAIVAWVDTLVAELPPSTERNWQCLHQALLLAHKVLADRHDENQPQKRNEKKDRLVSVADPDARSGWHHGFYYGYMLDVSMDADSSLITGVNVLPANGDEAADATTLISQEEQAHGNDVEALSIDGIGFRGELLREWTDPQGLKLEVIVPPKNDDAPEFFMGEQFTLNSTADALTCPARHTAQSRARSSNDTGWVYRFPRSCCQDCPLRARCMAALPKRGGRAVFKNDYEKEVLAVRAKAQTPEFLTARRQHWRIERKLGEMVRWHEARRARYRGLCKVLLQGLMTAIVVNIKRVVHLVTAQKVRAELAATS